MELQIEVLIELQIDRAIAPARPFAAWRQLPALPALRPFAQRRMSQAIRQPAPARPLSLRRQPETQRKPRSILPASSAQSCLACSY
jgi:hypothetical protein